MFAACPARSSFLSALSCHSRSLPSGSGPLRLPTPSSLWIVWQATRIRPTRQETRSKGSVQWSRACEPMRGTLSTPLCRGSRSQSVCFHAGELDQQQRTPPDSVQGGWATHSAHQGSVCVSPCKQIHWPGPVTTTASVAPQSLRRPKRLHLLIIPPPRRWTARPSLPVS